MIGGACMFEYFGTNLNIGKRNADKVRTMLTEHNIQLAAEDIGGKVGRSVTFLPAENGKVVVRRADGKSDSI
jgi:chemotaxis protein CheD